MVLIYLLPPRVANMTHSWMHTCLHMCMHTCMHTCIRTHTHAHTHTHTHTTVSILDCRLEVNSPISLHMLSTTPSLKNNKVWNWKSVSLFPLSHYHWKLSCYRTKKSFVCRHVCALFSADILQAGTVKKMIINSILETTAWEWELHFPQWFIVLVDAGNQIYWSF